jgi:hypothetical protein
VQDRISTTISVIMETPTESARLHRRLGSNQDSAIDIFFSPADSTRAWLTTYNATACLAKQALPPNVHLLSFETRSWANSTINGKASVADLAVIVRLQHIFPIDEHPELSQPVTVEINYVFPPNIVPQQIEEYSLSANQPMSSMRRLQWTSTQNDNEDDDVQDGMLKANKQRKNKRQAKSTATNTKVTLSPREIRAYVVEAIHLAAKAHRSRRH